MARQCKVLNVAEKNDAAKELSNVMGRGRVRRREGCSKFNKIYEFDFNLFGQNCQMVMTSVSGHLLAVDFILAYKNWNSCSPLSLFTADIQRYCPDNFLPIKRTLEREIRGCTHLILWTDGDREGEGIAGEIVDVVTHVKSRGLQIHRARFSEITHQSIMRACAQLDRMDNRVVDAVQVRQEVDLRIGCAFTRFQTKRMTKAFPSVLKDQLISYGPCQFPTLGFVVERYKQVQAFIPETFYKIKVTHDVDEMKVEFNWKRVRVFNHLVCLILYQICLGSPTAQVIGTSSRPRSKWRPLPLDTVEMEKLASRKLRISAKEAMKIAEKLYTQGYISYPRTETNIFPDSFDLPAIIQAQTGDPQWGAFAGSLLTRGATPRQGNKTDNAHPPIHPTKYTNNLQGDEKRIYELVVRHFLACCSQDARGQETTVDIEIAKEKFSASGLMILERNYLDVYPYDRWSTKVIPVYNQGSTFQPSSIEMCEGETTPPPLLHEADLIGLMEKHGIGTDATHADHIETIKTRNYVGVQHDGSLVPGELGMGLVEGYDSMGFELSKPQLRAELEADLKRICEGSKTKDEVLSSTLDKYKQVFVNATQQEVRQHWASHELEATKRKMTNRNVNQEFKVHGMPKAVGPPLLPRCLAKKQANKLEETLSHYFGPSQPVTEDEAPALGDVVRKCPACKQFDLVIKRKKDGGFMLSCLGFPDCRAVQYFPSCVTNVQADTSLCNICHPLPVHKLCLTLKPGSFPPYLGLEHIGCSSCDTTFQNELGVRPIKISNTTDNSTQSRTQTSTQTHQRGNARSTQPARDSSRTNHNPSPPRTGRGRKRPHPGNREEEQERVSPLPTRSQVPSAFVAPQSFNTTDTDNQTTCVCGEPALLLTVRREDSVNKGRQFYKCPRRDNGCNFFLWADETSSTNTATSTTQSRPSMAQHRGASDCGTVTTQQGATTNLYTTQHSSSNIVCKCSTQAVQRTVQKDGPNKGKQFYTCPKPRDSQCGFFEWADSVQSSSSTQGRGGKNSTNNRTMSEDGQGEFGRKQRKTRTCSVCRQQGHTKRTCPRAKDLA